MRQLNKNQARAVKQIRENMTRVLEEAEIIGQIINHLCNHGLKKNTEPDGDCPACALWHKYCEISPLLTELGSDIDHHLERSRE